MPIDRDLQVAFAPLVEGAKRARAAIAIEAERWSIIALRWDGTSLGVNVNGEPVIPDPDTED